MAEPSDRPAINDRLLRKKKVGGEYEKKIKCENKKNLNFFIQPGQKISARPGEVVTMRYMVESVN